MKREKTSYGTCACGDRTTPGVHRTNGCSYYDRSGHHDTPDPCICSTDDYHDDSCPRHSTDASHSAWERAEKYKAEAHLLNDERDVAVQRAEKAEDDLLLANEMIYLLRAECDSYRAVVEAAREHVAANAAAFPDLPHFQGLLPEQRKAAFREQEEQGANRTRRIFDATRTLVIALNSLPESEGG